MLVARSAVGTHSCEPSTLRGGTVPAFECVRCRAVALSEDAATTQDERMSVRTAIAIREAVCAEPVSR